MTRKRIENASALRRTCDRKGAVRDPSGKFAPSAGRLLIIFAPILMLIASTAVLALAAWLIGWYRSEMLIAAALTGPLPALDMSAVPADPPAQAATRALESVTARVSDIVESAMDPIVTIDADQRIVVFNAAAEKASAGRATRSSGSPSTCSSRSASATSTARMSSSFGAPATTRGRWAADRAHGLARNGEEFPIEASISQHSEEGRQLFTVILRDVTERIERQALLARSEARLRGILDSAMDAIITVDDTQHVVLFNAAAETMFGCPRQEAIGAPLAWFIPERFRARARRARAALRRDRHRVAAHGRAAHRHGPAPQRRGVPDRRVDLAARRTGGKFYTVILRDVSERVRAEEALRRSKDELHELGAAAHAAREQEKSRIARELHDELGQSLTALQMDVAWCKEKIPEGQRRRSAKLDKMEACWKRRSRRRGGSPPTCVR